MVGAVANGFKTRAWCVQWRGESGIGSSRDHRAIKHIPVSEHGRSTARTGREVSGGSGGFARGWLFRHPACDRQTGDTCGQEATTFPEIVIREPGVPGSRQDAAREGRGEIGRGGRCPSRRSRRIKRVSQEQGHPRPLHGRIGRVGERNLPHGDRDSRGALRSVTDGRSDGPQQ